MKLYDPLGYSEYRAMQSARDFQIACHQAADEGAKPHPLMDGGPSLEPSVPVLADLFLDRAPASQGKGSEAQESTGAEPRKSRQRGTLAADGSTLGEVPVIAARSGIEKQRSDPPASPFSL